MDFGVMLPAGCSVLGTTARVIDLCYRPTQLEEASMFPEYRNLITQLKGQDAHFTRMFDKHNSLDQEIKNKQAHIEPGTQIEIERLKKEKLALKDELFAILKKASAAA
jgi:hypothetical protein